MHIIKAANDQKNENENFSVVNLVILFAFDRLATYTDKFIFFFRVDRVHKVQQDLLVLRYDFYLKKTIF